MRQVYQGNLLGARFPSARTPSVEYLLERQLGEGSTAMAYLGLRVAGDGATPVVLKVTLPAFARKTEQTALIVARKEFESLARMTSRVPPSPFVVRLYDAGEVSYAMPGRTVTLPWLALEYVHGGVEGTTLEERLAHSLRTTGYGFDRARAARLVEHLCMGLAEAHDVGIIHRDVTPNNVLCCGVGGTELFKLSDFGIARPKGLEVTLGVSVLGTPGYMPPEQLGVGEIGTYSDVFSVAAVVYQALAGTPYFTARSPIEALTQGQAASRTPLAAGKHLVPELRQDEATCRELDVVLAQASAADPAQRPASTRNLASELIALLVPRQSASTGGVMLRNTLMSPVAPDQRWVVRHAPGDDRVVHSAAWDSDGRCFAATSRGLELWDGTTWIGATDDQFPVPSGMRCVQRVGPGRWLVGGARAVLAEVASRGTARVIRGPDERWTFTIASGDPDDLDVFVAHAPGQPPALVAFLGGRWLKPLVVTDAAFIASLSRLDDDHWLVTGRSVHQRGFAGVFAPLRWELETITVAENRAYVASAGQHERSHALAAGAGGRVVELEEYRVRQLDLPEPVDLSAAALDIVGRRWVGSAGTLWVSAGENSSWVRAWSDPQWSAPIVSLYADVGLVVALTADGAVLENRTSRSEIGAAMVRRASDRPL
ncbi:MAG: serine/threonine protein kinase [Polyangiaceae bacterium]|nr:serine/threonine protein kinase [Polyangiaceae bacterium]